MSRIPLIVIMLGLIVALPVSNVYGANTQGLHWGLEGGDRLDYDVTYYSIYPSEPYVIPPGVTVHERLYVIIKPLGPVPETVTWLGDIVLENGYYVSNYSVYYENGSTVGWPISDSFSPPILAFPVGDWPLVAGFVYPASSPGFEAIDNESMWGQQWIDAAHKTVNIYSKSDGALYQHIYEIHNMTGGHEIEIVTNRVDSSTDTSATTSGTRTGGTLTDIAVDIALVCSVVVIVLAVLLIKKRPQQ